MLRKQDLRFTYFFLRIYSALCLIPIRVDPETLEISRETRLWKRVVLGMHRTALTLHMIFITSRFVQATVNFEEEDLRHFGCAILCNLTVIAVRIEDYDITHVHLDLCIALNNTLMHHFEGNERGRRGSSWHTWSAQDLYLVMTGAGLCSINVAHLLIYFISGGTAFNFVHSIIPEEHQNVLTLLIGTVVEVYQTVGWGSVATFCVQQNLMLFRACEEKLDRAIGTIWKENQRQGERGRRSMSPRLLDSVNRTCGQVRMLTHLFNTAYRLSIFTHKIMYMSGSIFSFFIGIYLLRFDPVIAVVYLWVGFIANVQFVIVYAKTYKIPQGIARLKQEMELGNFLIPSKPQFELRKQVNSKRIAALPVIGIQVGSFRVMERETIPVYLDFVIGQVVDLLLTF